MRYAFKYTAHQAREHQIMFELQEKLLLYLNGKQLSYKSNNLHNAPKDLSPHISVVFVGPSPKTKHRKLREN